MSQPSRSLVVFSKLELNSAYDIIGDVVLDRKDFLLIVVASVILELIAIFRIAFSL